MPVNSSTTQAPPQVAAITAAAKELGFVMSCVLSTGALLRTLAASKPGGRLLELGTGAGMSTSWILSGMTPGSTLVTVENNADLVQTAQTILDDDARVTFVTADAADYLSGAQGETFDLIFADTWAGKFEQLDEALALLAPGGLYVVDDLDPQPEWPDGHAPKVSAFRERLQAVPWLAVTWLDCSTGLMIAARLS